MLLLELSEVLLLRVLSYLDARTLARAVLCCPEASDETLWTVFWRLSGWSSHRPSLLPADQAPTTSSQKRTRGLSSRAQFMAKIQEGRAYSAAGVPCRLAAHGRPVLSPEELIYMLSPSVQTAGTGRLLLTGSMTSDATLAIQSSGAGLPIPGCCYLLLLLLLPLPLPLLFLGPLLLYGSGSSTIGLNSYQ